MFTAPIPVALPLLMAALLAALNRRIPQNLSAWLSILTTVAVGSVAAAMAVQTRGGALGVYWFGGWTPRPDQAIGIAFAIDPAGALLVVVASILMLASLVFSLRYFDTAGTLYHALMLAFLGAMSGFSLTGDLFNLFVFFELMSAAAFALCGYKSEEAGPLEGALNFAVTNAIGAFLVLVGISLLYARTGALNLAQIGERLTGPSDALVACALAFIVCGFFVKGAIVPFHFWLADAHTVAPAPVCVLFSGIMVELGLYAVVRIYWSVFSQAMAPHEHELRHLLAAFGAATALIGSVMCFAQRHLKRLLAFSTISHMGVVLLAIALLTPTALGGAAVYVVGHAMLKGGLFLAAGILLHRAGTLDEFELITEPRRLGFLGILFFFGAAGLAGIPPFATFRGEAMVGSDAERLGSHWIGPVAFLVASVTAAAVLRFVSRGIFRWGTPVEAFTEAGSKIPEKPEAPIRQGGIPAAMTVPTAGLLLLGALAGLLPGLTASAESAAVRTQDRVAYARQVLALSAASPPAPHAPPVTAGDLAHAFGALGFAVLLAAGTLGSARLRRAASPFKPLIKTLRQLHSGIIPDYVTWLVFGVAVFGMTMLVILR